MKVTNLEFRICDTFGMKDTPDGCWGKDVHERTIPLCSQKDVEKKINAVLEKLGDTVIDIKTNFKTIYRHNNAGCDTIYEFVTIISK